MTNRLARSSSPYLQQHAENPVDWWEWGDEAFAEARRRDVPIFLSVGYAACHWCHVMAHESFEDEDIAAVLNANFVSVKVDREERPDVDSIYMAATTALTGHGGWPMSVWLDHEGRPFYAGTYFPARPRPGMVSFPQLLTALAQAWRDRRDEVLNSAENISGALATNRLQVQTAPLVQLSIEDDPTVGLETACDAAVHALAGSFDVERGGFGGAPKFPPSMVLEFLIRYRATRGNDAGAGEMTAVTLAAMARGGMYDQLAGGFARYSVDADWVVPHFEKMLYDNALLLRVYANWWRLTGDELARRVVHQTAEFLIRDLRTEQGGFAAALDADAVPSPELAAILGHSGQSGHSAGPPADSGAAAEAGSGSAVEGASYVWTPGQLAALLGPQDGPWAAQLLGVTAAGTFEHGTSTLQMRRDPDDPQRWERVRAPLLEARNLRPQPLRDDKVVTAWNGLAIAALAQAGAIFDEPEWIDAAAAAAALIADLHEVDSRLRRVSRDGVVGNAAGVLADYADFGDGLLALYQATGDARWYRLARELLTTAVKEFRRDGVWVDHLPQGTLPAGSDVADNAEPAGTSAMAQALLTLAALGGGVDDDGPMVARRIVGELLAGQLGLMGRQPRFAGNWLSVALAWLAGPLEVAIVGPRRGGEGAGQLLATARRSSSPGLVIAVGAGSVVPPASAADAHGHDAAADGPAAGGGESDGAGGADGGANGGVGANGRREADVDGGADTDDAVEPPLLRDREAIDGRATAYVCTLGACLLPTTDAEELAAQLHAGGVP